MNISYMRNIGAQLTSLLAANHDLITAGGAKDNVAQNGRAVDRLNYMSGVLAIPVSCVLAASQTATVTAKIQDSADGSTGWADYFTPAASLDLVVADGADENGVYEFDVDLSGAKQYVRVVYTVNMSAGATDTADLLATLT